MCVDAVCVAMQDGFELTASTPLPSTTAAHRMIRNRQMTKDLQVHVTHRSPQSKEDENCQALTSHIGSYTPASHKQTADPHQQDDIELRIRPREGTRDARSQASKTTEAIHSREGIWSNFKEKGSTSACEHRKERNSPRHSSSHCLTPRFANLSCMFAADGKRSRARYMLELHSLIGQHCAANHV